MTLSWLGPICHSALMAPPTRYIYGRHPVLEALLAQPQAILALFVQQAQEGSRHDGQANGAQSRAQALAKEHNIPVRMVSRAALDRLLGGDAVHQGLAAQSAPFAYTALEDLAPPAGTAPLYVLLDQVQDPHNVGAIARSALALGAHALILGKDRACDITPTVIKAAAGATAHLPIAQVTNISRTLTTLSKQGLWVVGTAFGPATQPLVRVDLTLPTVLVIGHEGSGMRPLTAKHCDVQAHIPIANIGSLNASVAAAICLYEAARQRG